MNLETYAWIVIAAPLVGALIIALGGSRLPAKGASLVACLAVLVGFLGSLGALLRWNALDAPKSGRMFTGWSWLTGGSFDIGFDIFIDPLSIWMMLVVTGVGFLIHVYSIGYMDGDPAYRRFFAYLNVFIFSMLMLVMAGNLVFLLVGWGLVGMASYLLIGFWHDRPSAVVAAKKAFIVNAVGDVSILLGALLAFREAGELTYPALFERLPQVVAADSGTAFAICVLLLGGALAKSAQLPLHTWLPDAMEGPTPVSALIHAATMVTAGVYLISRMHPIFDLSTAAQQLIIAIGSLTLLMAGFTALAQTDIKRVIAYSTMSQIGYMFVAAGLGAYGAAMFHLMTHAFFKALLFLGAGMVIHALDDEQDIRKMGGLKKHMPKTYWLFLAGSLALAAVFPFAGFFSKDEILAHALGAGDLYGGWAYFAYGLGLVGALLTGIYSFRLLFLVFHGEESELVARYGRGELAHHGHGHGAQSLQAAGGAAHAAAHSGADHTPSHGDAHRAHGEAPATMFWPVVLLGVGTVFGGLLAVVGLWNVPERFLSHAGAAPTREALEQAMTFSDAQLWLISALSMALGLVGIGIASMVWRTRDWESWRDRFPRLEHMSQQAFGWDALYEMTLVRPAQGAAAMFVRFDERVVAPGTQAVGALAARASGLSSRAHTGLVRLYALGTVLAMIAVVVAFLVVEG